VLAEVAGWGWPGRPGRAYIPCARESNRASGEVRPVWATGGCQSGSGSQAALLLAQRFGRPEGNHRRHPFGVVLLNPARYEQTLENVASTTWSQPAGSRSWRAGHRCVGLDQTRLQYASNGRGGAKALAQLKSELGKEVSGSLCRPGIAVGGTWPAWRPGDSPGPGISPAFWPGPGSGDAAREREIYALAARNFSSSRPTVGRILFEKMKLTPREDPGKTAYSTDVEVLQALGQESPIAAKVLEYRSMGKLKSTYVDAS